jgi:hypothetical protein
VIIQASADDGVQTMRHQDSQQFGRDVDCVRAATPQCGYLPRVLCPLATALYAKDTGLIILHVSPD